MIKTPILAIAAIITLTALSYGMGHRPDNTSSNTVANEDTNGAVTTSMGNSTNSN